MIIEEYAMCRHLRNNVLTFTNVHGKQKENDSIFFARRVIEN